MVDVKTKSKVRLAGLDWILLPLFLKSCCTHFICHSYVAFKVVFFTEQLKSYGNLVQMQSQQHVHGEEFVSEFLKILHY